MVCINCNTFTHLRRRCATVTRLPSLFCVLYARENLAKIFPSSTNSRLPRYGDNSTRSHTIGQRFGTSKHMLPQPCCLRVVSLACSALSSVHHSTACLQCPHTYVFQEFPPTLGCLPFAEMSFCVHGRAPTFTYEVHTNRKFAFPYRLNRFLGNRRTLRGFLFSPKAHFVQRLCLRFRKLLSNCRKLLALSRSPVQD